MLHKAHLTSHSRMAGSRWMITPSWLSGLWQSFFVQFCVFLPHLLNIFCFCSVPTISVLYWAHLCMKCSLRKWKKKVVQSCPTLCDPMDCSLLGSSIHGLLQTRILEWVAISFSRGSSWPRDQTPVSCIAGRHFNLWAIREVLEEISSLSHSIVFLYFFALITEEGFLISPC